jgi:hypothetical protein
VRSFGDNYTLSPTARAVAFFSSSDVTQDERVGAIEILDAGSGHSDGEFALIVQCNMPTCTGSGFSATYNVSGGKVVSTRIVHRGSGYSLSAPIVYVQCVVQPSLGPDCVPASLITKVPHGARLDFLPPFTAIEGLTGLQGPPSGRIPTTAYLNDAEAVYGSEADWNLEEGKLTLYLRRPAINLTRYGLAVRVLNPVRGQSAVDPLSSGRAGFIFARQYLRRGLGNAAPLLVCNVTRALIVQVVLAPDLLALSISLSLPLSHASTRSHSPSLFLSRSLLNLNGGQVEPIARGLRRTTRGRARSTSSPSASSFRHPFCVKGRRLLSPSLGSRARQSRRWRISQSRLTMAPGTRRRAGTRHQAHWWYPSTLSSRLTHCTTFPSN